MLGKSPDQQQTDLFKNLLANQLNPQHPLCLFAQVIPWKKLEEEFAPLYGTVGLPSHPIRKMAALLMLKHLYNLSDERVVDRWETDPYYQYLAGEATFQWGQPCAASDLVHFRHRLSEKGIEKLFALSIALHADKVRKISPSLPMLSSTRRSLSGVTALLKVAGFNYARAIGLWYNACSMPNVMPTCPGVLKKQKKL